MNSNLLHLINAKNNFTSLHSSENVWVFLNAVSEIRKGGLKWGK